MTDEPHLPHMHGRLRFARLDDGGERLEVVDEQGDVVGHGYLEVYGVGPVIFYAEDTDTPGEPA